MNLAGVAGAAAGGGRGGRGGRAMMDGANNEARGATRGSAARGFRTQTNNSYFRHIMYVIPNICFRMRTRILLEEILSAVIPNNWH